MQPDAVSDKLRRQKVSLDELPGREDAGHEQDAAEIGPELHQRHADGQHAAGDRAGVGNEGQGAGNDADGQPELETHER